MIRKNKIADFPRRRYSMEAWEEISLKYEEIVRDENVNKVFKLDDDFIINFSSLDYFHWLNNIHSSKSFEDILKYDFKRIEIFKEKFDLEKYNQRSKKYNKLEDYWVKSFNERFIDFMENLKKYMKIPYQEISPDYPIKTHPINASDITDNLVILSLYFSFVTSTKSYTYCFDKYFDRFNFNYDIDIKFIKGEIDKEIREVFEFSSNLVANLEGAVPIDIAEKLLKFFRGGRQLLPTKETKYKLVAEYITIMEKHFKISTGIQRIACELADVNPYSFSAWKNAKNKAGEKENSDIILKWRKEKIPSEKVEELKTKVSNYLKSS